jgi:DNA-binding transcriptional regulator YhcF (GntR family)
MYHFRVDKLSAQPIYLQIRNYLVAEILAGRLQPGEKIPSANELSKQMGVSKMTVLHALGDLNRTDTFSHPAAKARMSARPENWNPICAAYGVSPKLSGPRAIVSAHS